MITTFTTFMILLIIFAILIGCFIYSVKIYERGVDLAPLHAEKQQLEKEIASGHNTLSDLKSQMINIRAEEANANQTIAEAKFEREWLDNNSDKIASMKDNIAHLKEDLKPLLDKINDRTEEINEKNSQLQKIAGEIQSLELQIQRDSAKIEEAKQTKKDLYNDIIKSQNEKNNINANLEKIRNEYRENLSQLDRVKAKLEEENRNLEREKTMLKNIKQEYQNNYQNLNDLKSKINNHEVKEAELSKRLKFKEAEVATGKHQWEDLNRKVFEYPTISTTKNLKNEIEWLDQFKDNLNSNGIKFNERMIDAFHTGLKVADNSPLVVLAGISGTGKSLLPRLYAHAIGMNFQQIAVQPRWDSPQDMFGFYNYMESRYKATELSRLLWQFDKYNNDEAKKYCNAILPMNLVLLDEMNLARVEYYFSDMLSKLEVRRGLNPQDEKQRRSAEIEIECGASKQDSETRRLYVGSNTLFVGTMNEDESTQSLSDKVMDRSNVLRFGQPENLNAEPKINNFIAKYDKTVLTMDKWQNDWINSDNIYTNKLEQIMTEINSDLAKIGRPFAHRVWQAMKSYVNNYPIKGELGFRQAVADQIEMKILPKLNGIEKDNSNSRDVLNNLGNAINDLNDEKLANTYKEVCENSNELFFQWRGVMR